MIVLSIVMTINVVRTLIRTTKCIGSASVVKKKEQSLTTIMHNIAMLLVLIQQHGNLIDCRYAIYSK